MTQQEIHPATTPGNASGGISINESLPPTSPNSSSLPESINVRHSAIARKPLKTNHDAAARLQETPASPVRVNQSSGAHLPTPSSTQVFEAESMRHSLPQLPEDSSSPSQVPRVIHQSTPHQNAFPQQHTINGAVKDPRQGAPGPTHSAIPRELSGSSLGEQQYGGSGRSRHSSYGSIHEEGPEDQSYPQLQYHHQFSESTEPSAGTRYSHGRFDSLRSDSQASSLAGDFGPHPQRRLTPLGSSYGRLSVARPSSAYSSLSLSEEARGRTSANSSPGLHPRGRVPSAHSGLESRPTSYIDLLAVPYPQAPPATGSFNNSQLRTAVGSNASLLSHKQTFEMYRANVKKSNDPATQYEFAVFMISAAQEAAASTSEHGDASSQTSPKGGRDLESPYVDNSTPAATQTELLREARQILGRLADRSYPFAQYYLADGYSSGLFTKGKEDYDKAFPLFVAAGKHGHAEASYRAALCYEFGWGSRSDPAKAVQFYRQSASKNHPGAMTRLGKACITGDLGLQNRYREGLKWLKRATESADYQYNSAPYELGLLHETGYGDDIFMDERYAAQLFTQAAELGHPEASYRLGDAYEHGKLCCPRDPALSVHFYNGAAQQGHPAAMMALCAWYMVGAEPVLEKDECEAYEWARKAAESGLAKAEYAVGYFTEMGIGCRRDPLEANVWYVQAADQGDERATHRLAAIRAAASGNMTSATSLGREKIRKGSSAMPGGANGERDCAIM